MKRFELRAAATALGAIERPRGDRISIWRLDAAPEMFRGLKIEDRNPSWVVYVPPCLLASGIARSLRQQKHGRVAVYRMHFGGVVYVGEGRCIDTDAPGIDAVPCQVVTPTFLNFSREWMLHVFLAFRGVARELRPRVLNAIAFALKLSQARVKEYWAKRKKTEGLVGSTAQES
jgi:hypothetical protein